MGKLVALVVPDDFPVDSLAPDAPRQKGLVPSNMASNYLMNVVQQVVRALGKRTIVDAKQTDWELGMNVGCIRDWSGRLRCPGPRTAATASRR
jgi:hypothetical protein